MHTHSVTYLMCEYTKISIIKPCHDRTCLSSFLYKCIHYYIVRLCPHVPLHVFFSSPKAVGDAGCDGEQGDDDHHAGRDDHVPPLLLLGLLKLPPLQVTELTALAHVAWYTAATGATKTQLRVTLNASAINLSLLLSEFNRIYNWEIRLLCGSST